MMKKRIFALLAALCIALGCLAGCNSETPPASGSTTEQPEVKFVDYAGDLVLDMNSGTAKQEVTIKNFVDGDTTHFYVPTSVAGNGLLKARYLAVNTPESTGKIEEWGKKASNFTKEKLSSATSIMIESDNGVWNLDSTGERHLVWVWYKPEGSATYRNLNVELLQNGLSLASNSADNRYGETCMAAIQQAKASQLHIHSKEKDPEFYYGEALPVTLKGLRTNIELYEGMKVAFEGVITHESAQTVYVEAYDDETDMYYGMTVYYGWNLTGTGLEMMAVGNKVRIVGSVQYYATGGTWQVSDVKYVDMRPNDPNNVQLISKDNPAAHRLIKGLDFAYDEVEVEVLKSLDDDLTEMKTFDYAELLLSTSVSMERLKVNKISTTTNEDSASKGAMTMTCTATDGTTIVVRTAVLRDEDGNTITAKAYQGKTINVRGIVDYFSGSYQVKVLSANDITVVK